ncbi:BTB/POZ domain-containing protein 2-like [Cephus cinctus]|uniref:BTB/POZ domain-containing protein 2-like n=1 Tax=Cephus cinctus TaxID=211228 RepID=A0AAJ7FV72_CEPCN|nr:BTB/POZ domain-containing protein 2-like [Cephus cinctus]
MGLPCDWQITKQRVAERGQYLLESGQWSDCKFIVGQEPHQQELQGHKLFLAMSSPVFEAMFFGGMAEKNDPIPIRDVQPEAFKALLQYIYTDDVDLGSFELACELCYCAKKYMLPHLVEKCTKFLWCDLSPKKACRAYEFAKLFEEPILMEKCLHIISTKTSEVLREPSWEEIELTTLLMIFDQDALKIYSEIELFNAVERWARAECIRKCLDPTDQKALKSVIGNALAKIRFLTLTPQEFAEGPAKSPLLTQSEAFHILLNISSSEKTFIMPEGFSNHIMRRLEPPIFEKAIPLWNTSPIPSTDSRSLKKFSFRSNIQQFPLKTIFQEQKYYCQRPVLQLTDCLNSSVLDCSVTFSVNKDIDIIGVVVPAQVCSMARTSSSIFSHNTPGSSTYTEVLYAHLLDPDGCRLTYTHFTTKATPGSLVEITFNMSIKIQQGKIYRVGVAFNKTGVYPMAACPVQVHSNSVTFSFGVGNPENNTRDGLIRSIVFFDRYN